MTRSCRVRVTRFGAQHHEAKVVIWLFFVTILTMHEILVSQVWRVPTRICCLSLY